MAAFCRERGLRDSQFFAWKKRLRNAEAAQFVEVSPAEEPVQSSAAGNHAIEVRLAGGQNLKLAGCDALTTDVTPAKLDAEQVHTSYMALEKVERDFRAMKTGLLEARPIFVRKEGRTRGHVFCCMLALKLAREMKRRLRVAFGATETNPDAITLPDALAALGRLCLLHWPVEGENIVTKLPLPDQSQQEILAALGIHLPAM